MVDQQERRTRRELGLRGIFELACGYQRAQVLFAANELGVFRILSSGQQTAEQVAGTLGTEVRGIEALLEACVALSILRRSDKGYENSRTARMFLAPEREASFCSVLKFWQRFSYGPWGRLTEAVRSNQPQTASGPKPKDLFDQLLEDDEQTHVFFDGLAGLAYWPAQKLVDMLDFPQRHHVLDVGGGAGAFSAMIAKSHPHLRVTLFDLEQVCDLARERFAKADSNGRLQVMPGDFHNDPLPSGVDCVLLSNVLHDWSAAECVAILKKVYQALEPGGEVVIYDFMPARGEQSVEANLFALTLLLDTNRGRVFPFEEVQGWLEECGFRETRQEPVVGGTSVVVALKP